MSTLAQSLGEIKKPWQWLAIGGAILLIWAAIAIPSLNRSRLADQTMTVAHRQEAAELYAGAATKAKSAAGEATTEAVSMAVAQLQTQDNDAAGRKIIRTSSLEMVVQHPSETAEKIAALAESMGGYVDQRRWRRTKRHIRQANHSRAGGPALNRRAPRFATWASAWRTKHRRSRCHPPVRRSGRQHPQSAR